MALKYERADILRVVATTQFREFTKHDWYGYAGCETSNPLIATVKIDGETDHDIIIDGDQVSIFKLDGDISDANHQVYTLHMG